MQRFFEQGGMAANPIIDEKTLSMCVLPKAKLSMVINRHDARRYALLAPVSRLVSVIMRLDGPIFTQIDGKQTDSFWSSSTVTCWSAVLGSLILFRMVRR